MCAALKKAENAEGNGENAGETEMGENRENAEDKGKNLRGIGEKLKAEKPLLPHLLPKVEIKRIDKEIHELFGFFVRPK